MHDIKSEIETIEPADDFMGDVAVLMDEYRVFMEKRAILMSPYIMLFNFQKITRCFS